MFVSRQPVEPSMKKKLRTRKEEYRNEGLGGVGKGIKGQSYDRRRQTFLSGDWKKTVAKRNGERVEQEGLRSVGRWDEP